MENEYFSLFSQEQPSNQDLTIVYTPDPILVKYTYRVYNDGTLIDAVKVNTNEPRQITLNATGKYQIKVTGYDKFDREFDIESGMYIIDKEAPKLDVGENMLTLSVGDQIDAMSGVTASDNMDGNITSSITSNLSSLDLSHAGTQKLVYSVSDVSGNTTTKSIVLNIQERNTLGLITVQVSLISVLFLIIYLLLKYQKSLRLEKRFGKYSVVPLKDESPSLFDRIGNKYKNLVYSMSTVVTKSYFLTKYSKRFDKYLLFTKDKYRSGIDIVASKLLVSIIFLIIAAISKTIQYQLLSVYEVCFPMILGFFSLDIVYALEYKIYREKIENDLLQAIIIMNNCFKSGRSIVQAIELVGNELHGVIGSQFKKMRDELATGLSIEDVFGRFAERINIEEVSYLTASLSILNKTGGNIIKVFSSIERSLFLKKKLKLELKSLTGSSKIIMWVLFCVPILFIVIISMLSPGYFNPFFANPIGIMLFFVMIIYYVLYVVAVRKILKVRM